MNILLFQWQTVVSHPLLQWEVAMPLLELSMVTKWPMTVSVAMIWKETKCWHVGRQGNGEHLPAAYVSEQLN